LSSKAWKTAMTFPDWGMTGSRMAVQVCALFAALAAAGGAFKVLEMDTATQRTLTPATVYSIPDDKSPVTGDLSAGHALTVLSEKGEWLKIKARAGQEVIQGYIKKDRTNF